MKYGLMLAVFVALLSGCSTVQVARLDTTLSATKTIELYQDWDELKGKQYTTVAHLAYNKPVSPQNYTEALGALLNKARQIGAQALVVETPLSEMTGTTVFRGTAILYEP